ncbi:MAG: hypothetical protein RL291_28 [Pseudomonadota bacterium]
MNWISNVVRPKIRGLLTTRREPPDNFWLKCPSCGQMTDTKTLADATHVFPCCGHHDRIGAEQRLKYAFDDGVFTRVPVAEVPQDPLKFRDGQKYVDRLKDAKAKTQMPDAVLIGEGMIGGHAVVAAAQDFRFMGGSLGMAAGEAVITGMLKAVEKKTPFVLFAASGGARMQEGILSLMQMPRTTIAVQRLREARLPYIVVLTDPTTGGVTASYAMLGDVQIAEPGALICFAGPRVIEQTIREQLPEGFQRAEYLLAHGMIDMVVHRHELKETLATLIGLLEPRDHATARHGQQRPGLNGPALNGRSTPKPNGTYGDKLNGADIEAVARGAGADASDTGVSKRPPTDATQKPRLPNGRV